MKEVRANFLTQVEQAAGVDNEEVPPGEECV